MTGIEATASYWGGIVTGICPMLNTCCCNGSEPGRGIISVVVIWLLWTDCDRPEFVMESTCSVEPGDIVMILLDGGVPIDVVCRTSSDSFDWGPAMTVLEVGLINAKEGRISSELFA